MRVMSVVLLLAACGGSEEVIREVPVVSVTPPRDGDDVGSGDMDGTISDIKLTSTTVSGLVKDSASGKPLANIVISTVPATESFQTSQQGQYVLNVGRAFGMLTIRGTNPDYTQAFPTCVNLKPDTNSVGDIAMVRNTIGGIAKDCFTPCSGATMCLNGTCISKCSPLCNCSERCTDAGTCEPDTKEPDILDVSVTTEADTSVPELDTRTPDVIDVSDTVVADLSVPELDTIPAEDAPESVDTEPEPLDEWQPDDVPVVVTPYPPTCAPPGVGNLFTPSFGGALAPGLVLSELIALEDIIGGRHVVAAIHGKWVKVVDEIGCTVQDFVLLYSDTADGCVLGVAPMPQGGWVVFYKEKSPLGCVSNGDLFAEVHQIDGAVVSSHVVSMQLPEMADEPVLFDDGSSKLRRTRSGILTYKENSKLGILDNAGVHVEMFTLDANANNPGTDCGDSVVLGNDSIMVPCGDGYQSFVAPSYAWFDFSSGESAQHVSVSTVQETYWVSVSAVRNGGVIATLTNKGQGFLVRVDKSGVLESEPQKFPGYKSSSGGYRQIAATTEDGGAILTMGYQEGPFSYSGFLLVGRSCSSDTQCDDSNPYTSDVCTAWGCDHLY